MDLPSNQIEQDSNQSVSRGSNQNGPTKDTITKDIKQKTYTKDSNNKEFYKKFKKELIKNKSIT